MKNLIFITIFILPSCAHNVANFKLISNDPALAIGAPFGMSTVTTVTGESCGHNVVGFLIGERHNYEKALAAALKSAPGNNALANASFTTNSLNLLVYARVCYVATGIPMNLPVR